MKLSRRNKQDQGLNKEGVIFQRTWRRYINGINEEWKKSKKSTREEFLRGGDKILKNNIMFIRSTRVQ